MIGRRIVEPATRQMQPLRTMDLWVPDRMMFHSRCFDRWYAAPSRGASMSVIASLEKSRKSLRTGGWRRASFHA